jgi:hypothetical protein
LQSLPIDPKVQDWLQEIARTRLSKLENDKKVFLRCETGNDDCAKSNALKRELLWSERIQPVFVRSIQFKGDQHGYIIGYFAPILKGDEYSIWYDGMPNAFLIARTEKNQPLRLIYSDINTSLYKKAITFLDLLGDEQPEMITQIDGNEWWAFEVFTLGKNTVKRVWSGGGGGC